MLFQQLPSYSAFHFLKLSKVLLISRALPTMIYVQSKDHRGSPPRSQREISCRSRKKLRVITDMSSWYDLRKRPRQTRKQSKNQRHLQLYSLNLSIYDALTSHIKIIVSNSVDGAWFMIPNILKEFVFLGNIEK